MADAEARRAEGWEFALTATYVEIYNERIRDLLNPANDNLQVHGLSVCRCSCVVGWMVGGAFALVVVSGIVSVALFVVFFVALVVVVVDAAALTAVTLQRLLLFSAATVGVLLLLLLLQHRDCCLICC